MKNSQDPYIDLERLCRGKNGFIEESNIRCAPIDARILVFEKEFHALTAEYNRIKDTPVPSGFFARIKAHSIVKDLCNRMDLNREMLSILYKKRIANT